MDIEKTLKAIEELVGIIGKQAFYKRLTTYSAIRQLMSEIREYAKEREGGGEPIPNVNIYLTEMIGPFKALRGWMILIQMIAG